MPEVKMIENEEDICCANKHKQPIFTYLLDKSLPFDQRLQCLTCIKERVQSPQSMNFDQAKYLIQLKKTKLYEALSEIVNKSIKKLEKLRLSIDQLKSKINQQLEKLLGNANNWINYLVEFEKQKTVYSLLQELENFDETFELMYAKEIRSINQSNYSFYKKMESYFQGDFIIQGLSGCKQQLEDICEMTDSVQEIKDNLKMTEIEKEQILCEKHKQSILFIDITSEDRIKCAYCQKGEAIPIEEFKKQYASYQSNQKQQKQQKVNQQIILLKGIKDKLSSFVMDQQCKMQKMIAFIDEQLWFGSYIQQTKQKESFVSLKELIFKAADELSHNGTQVTSQSQSLITLQGMLKQIKGDSFNHLIDNQIEYEVIDNKVQQQEFCGAIAFNKQGTTMIAGCDKYIKLWDLENGRIKPYSVQLEGHSDCIYCLVHSKQHNWFASGGYDNTIRLWKLMDEWKSSQPGIMHRNHISCLLMNKSEDQLISSSWDMCIFLWKIDYESNQLQFQYSLEKHQDRVYQISLNSPETTLISCSCDKQIIVWVNNQGKWEYQSTISQSFDDYGKRISFLNDDTIAYLQCNQGQIHFFKLENERFEEKQNLRIKLTEQVYGEQMALFPAIFNKDKQVLICKHNKFVYFFKQLENGQIRVQSNYIDCLHQKSYGGLTNDGRYLIIWNQETKSFTVYQMKYY